MMTSCMNYENEYMGTPYDPSTADTLIVDDSGIVWADVADYSTSTLIERYWKVNDAQFESDSPEYHFTQGVDGEEDPSNNYWHQAHAMDVIVDAYLRAKESGDTEAQATYKAIFDNGYKNPIGDGSSSSSEGVLWTNFGGSDYRGFSPVFGNQYVDDMEWHTLTLLRLYRATGEVVYLQEAQKLFAQVLTAWNLPEGMAGDAGLCWCLSDDTKSKNACSNGPAVVAAMMLYEESQEASYATNSLAEYADYDYIAEAKSIYSWLKAVLFDKSSGAVYDGVSLETINSGTLTYNQGTFLGGAHLLYKATGEQSYLSDAILASDYAMNYLTEDGILKDEGATADNSLFKGIYVRYAAEMVNDSNIDYAYRCTLYDFLKNNAVTLWNDGLDRDENGNPTSLYTPDWTMPESQTIYVGGDYSLPLLGWQVSGATLMEAVASMDNPRN